MKSILLMFHYGQDVGYAVSRLVPVFIGMAKRLVVDPGRIHVSFTRLASGDDESLRGCGNRLAFDPATRDTAEHARLACYVESNGIDVIFGFDQPVRRPWYRSVRRAGVRRIISYQGAPMSSLNRGIKLWLKKAEVSLARAAPDHYIFESRAMAETAYRGRGIPRARTSIVCLGVDPERFRPIAGHSYHAYSAFGIPRDRRIVYYSGHMEERKGVSVLVRAARSLYERHGRRDFHFLILGNRDGQEQRFLDMLADSGAREHVTFGGYREDVERILPDCYIGAIASTGWDSFTMSSLEIAACGLPLLVSRLQGLVETVDNGETGILFEPGNHEELAMHIRDLLDDGARRDRLGANARQRILAGFTVDQQIENLAGVVGSIAGRQ